ncbi:hypothetical protein E2C01_030307 [Portunus trituberculatus]|uniref:Uncharacterized protein n=1 Tax=Portunus trituberculatus TaxID=210409 RepID=A0A5B7EQ37_PORTR|nr:hypothetical protein [Portunus trituberculatus]
MVVVAAAECVRRELLLLWSVERDGGGGGGGDESSSVTFLLPSTQPAHSLHDIRFNSLRISFSSIQVVSLRLHFSLSYFFGIGIVSKRNTDLVAVARHNMLSHFHSRWFDTSCCNIQQLTATSVLHR